jgi:hypothetical protein
MLSPDTMRSLYSITAALLLLLCCSSSGGGARQGDYVVLLHGLGKGPASMKKMEHYLSERGYRVINRGYPSTEHPIEYLGDHHLAAMIEECCPDRDRPIHFVTHSMGSVVLRRYLSRNSLPNQGRAVMLAPPGRGSSAADVYRTVTLARRILGPALDQIGTGSDSAIAVLGPLSIETGVIAGNATIDPFTSSMIPGDDDGRVAVEEARIENMKDFIVVNCSHTFIMDSPEVMEQTYSFLTTGTFSMPGRGTELRRRSGERIP